MSIQYVNDGQELKSNDWKYCTPINTSRDTIFLAINKVFVSVSSLEIDQFWCHVPPSVLLPSILIAFLSIAYPWTSYPSTVPSHFLPLRLILCTYGRFLTSLTCFPLNHSLNSLIQALEMAHRALTPWNSSNLSDVHSNGFYPGIASARAVHGRCNPGIGHNMVRRSCYILWGHARQWNHE